MVERIDTLVIGGSQAGLAISYFWLLDVPSGFHEVLIMLIGYPPGTLTWTGETDDGCNGSIGAWSWGYAAVAVG
jgi:hypothetical protein